MNDEKKGVKKMRTFAKSSKLDNVCYDIRGPVMDEANRMIEQGVEILKLNIGNPAPFGFKAPQELVDMMRGNLENAEGYSDSKGLLKSRQAIVEYCKKKNIPNVGVNDIYTGNGVSELITLSMNGLLDNGCGRHRLRLRAEKRCITCAMNSLTGIRISRICVKKLRIRQKALLLSIRTIRPVHYIQRKS